MHLQWMVCPLCIICLTFIFDPLKAHHEISPEPYIEQVLKLLTYDRPLYDLPGLNVKVPEKPIRSHIHDKDSGLKCHKL